MWLEPAAQWRGVQPDESVVCWMVCGEYCWIVLMSPSFAAVRILFLSDCCDMCEEWNQQYTIAEQIISIRIQAV